MSLAATVSTGDPRSYKSGSYGSSTKGSPDFEPEEIQAIRALVYENPSLRTFGPDSFIELDNGKAEAEHAIEFISGPERRFKFSFPEQADMYLSALAYLYFKTYCEELLKTTKNMSNNEIHEEVVKTVEYLGLAIAERPLTCKEKFMKFRTMFMKIRDGMMNTVPRAKQSDPEFLNRVNTIIQTATGGNLDFLLDLSEASKWSQGGARRKRSTKTRKATKGRKRSTKTRKANRKVRKATRKGRKGSKGRRN